MNSYEKLFLTLTEAGLAPGAAAERVFNTYLDGRPRRRGLVKNNFAELDAMMWESAYLFALPADVWETQAAVLALTRYIHSTQLSNMPLLEHLAKLAPAAVRKAVRYSGLVLHDNPLRRGEITHLAELLPREFAEIASILSLLQHALHERREKVEQCKPALEELSPLQMLMYASLYACEHLLPHNIDSDDTRMEAPDIHYTWEAINNLLIWKLTTTEAHTLTLSEADIVDSLRFHLIPFLNPAAADPVREDLYSAFCRLLIAQTALDSFIEGSADAFCYDDTVRFVLQADELKVVDIDAARQSAWQRNGERLGRLHEYWHYRARARFIESGFAITTTETAENQDANQIAWIGALRTLLQLDEVYGMDATVVTDRDQPVDLFEALLAQELMTQYFDVAFTRPYLEYYLSSGNSRQALFELTMSGLQQQGTHNLMPLTWSDRQTKIEKITSWTVSAEFPQGSSEAAEAILDFWTSDWALLSRRLKTGRAGPQPELFERPVLRMGSWLFQLPWLAAQHHNASAAINNLRRIGARRSQARAETHRIEQRLAQYLARRGFKTASNYVPPRAGGKAAGEIDIICAREGQVIVLEVKSTFLRHSIKDAWLHKSTTLRKAGLQLERKLEAVQLALQTDTALQRALDVAEQTAVLSVRGWIVDTSIEWDHERFNGFLKISLEELLIALRDDAHYLDDPDGLFGTESQHAEVATEGRSLYPDGFSVQGFIDVIENELVWNDPEDVL